jgi:protein involved in polysaccharide export with SLBB domain
MVEECVYFPNCLRLRCLFALLCKGAVAGEVQSAGIAEDQILMITNLPYLSESSISYLFVVKDSMINLPLIAPIKAQGLTNDQLKARISEAYKNTCIVPSPIEIQIGDHR